MIRAVHAGRYKNMILRSGITIILIIVIFLGVGPSLALAAKAKRPSPPINISSDRMEILDKQGTVHFMGHVRAIREQMVLEADDVVVYYATEEVDGKKKKVLKKIVAEGHVKVTEGDKVAIGDRAVYQRPKEIITLSGNAQIWQGKNRISGGEIVFFINENRSIVRRAKGQRVEATVFPRQ